MPDGAEKQTWVIPDYFYELIARMIPGSIAIAISMYWSESDFGKVASSVGLSVFALGVAWVLGATLDVGAFTFFKNAKRVCMRLDVKAFTFSKTAKWFQDKLETFACPVNPKLEVVRGLSDLDRRTITKAMALKILFRNMLVICVLTMLICLGMHVCPSRDFYLPRLQNDYWLYALLCCFLIVVFWGCWKELDSSISHWWTEQEKRLNTSAAGGSPS
jgi:hypothetical protein